MTRKALVPEPSPVVEKEGEILIYFKPRARGCWKKRRFSGMPASDYIEIVADLRKRMLYRNRWKARAEVK